MRDRFLVAGSPRLGRRPVSRLYCGFEDAIEIFDVQRPGQGERLPTTPSKKSRDGLRGEAPRTSSSTDITVPSHVRTLLRRDIGVVSALAFSYSPEYYAAGSLTPASRTSDNIALFNESVLEPVLSIGGVAEREMGGVTQVRRPLLGPCPGSTLVLDELVDVQPHATSYSLRRLQAERKAMELGPSRRPVHAVVSFLERRSLFERARRTPDEPTETVRHRRYGEVVDVREPGTSPAPACAESIGFLMITQLGQIAMYDLGVEDCQQAGEGEVQGETRQIGPELLHDAHGGRSMDPLVTLVLHSPYYHHVSHFTCVML